MVIYVLRPVINYSLGNKYFDYKFVPYFCDLKWGSSQFLPKKSEPISAWQFF